MIVLTYIIVVFNLFILKYNYWLYRVVPFACFSSVINVRGHACAMYTHLSHSLSLSLSLTLAHSRRKVCWKLFPTPSAASRTKFGKFSSVPGAREKRLLCYLNLLSVLCRFVEPRVYLTGFKYHFKHLPYWLHFA